MKQKTLREDAHSHEEETCRKRPREKPECVKAHSVLYKRIEVCVNRYFAAGMLEHS